MAVATAIASAGRTGGTGTGIGLRSQLVTQFLAFWYRDERVAECTDQIGLPKEVTSIVAEYFFHTGQKWNTRVLYPDRARITFHESGDSFDPAKSDSTKTTLERYLRQKLISGHPPQKTAALTAPPPERQFVTTSTSTAGAADVGIDSTTAEVSGSQDTPWVRLWGSLSFRDTSVYVNSKRVAYFAVEIDNSLRDRSKPVPPPPDGEAVTAAVVAAGTAAFQHDRIHKYWTDMLVVGMSCVPGGVDPKKSPSSFGSDQSCFGLYSSHRTSTKGVWIAHNSRGDVWNTENRFRHFVSAPAAVIGIVIYFSDRRDESTTSSDDDDRYDRVQCFVNDSLVREYRSNKAETIAAATVRSATLTPDEKANAKREYLSTNDAVPPLEALGYLGDDDTAWRVPHLIRPDTVTATSSTDATPSEVKSAAPPLVGADRYFPFVAHTAKYIRVELLNDWIPPPFRTPAATATATAADVLDGYRPAWSSGF